MQQYRCDERRCCCSFCWTSRDRRLSAVLSAMTGLVEVWTVGPRIGTGGLRLEGDVMPNFLFATLDAGGNLSPALGIGSELLRQGHRVRFLGHARQAAAVEAAGAEFIPYRHAAPLDLAVPAPAHRQFAAMLNVFSDSGIGRDLVEEARREPPDVVVVDCLLLGAIDAACEGRAAAGGAGAQLLRVLRRPVPAWSDGRRALAQGAAAAPCDAACGTGIGLRGPVAGSGRLLGQRPLGERPGPGGVVRGRGGRRRPGHRSRRGPPGPPGAAGRRRGSWRA